MNENKEIKETKEIKEIKEDNEKKEKFSAIWQKTKEASKKAADGAKAFAEQTKNNIYEAQAKKYTPVTLKKFKSKKFKKPDIIKIVDDNENRKFITDDNAMGWTEKHEGIDVLYMYEIFVEKSGVLFIPLAQQDNVYCEHNFDENTFINSNQIFSKSTEEKLAELCRIADSLGAKSYSVEIVETKRKVNSSKTSANHGSTLNADFKSTNSSSQSGKRTAQFEGSREPQRPDLKWFAHDDNIKDLIEMRCGEGSSVKNVTLKLKGSSSATMSVSIACTLDKLLGTKAKLSMERQALKEHSNTLHYEIEF